MVERCESILFGVVVGPNTDIRIAVKCIQSIHNAISELTNNHYKVMRGTGIDVVVCGSKETNEAIEEYINNNNMDGCDFIDFNETIKPGWITRKKNIITEKLGYNYDLICFVHDYYQFDKDFLIEFYNWRNAPENDRYQLFQPRINTKEGTRHSDWLVSQRYIVAVLQRHPELQPLHQALAGHGEQIQYICGLPYTEHDLTHIQYISGGFIFGETSVFQSIPLDENRTWGQEEDIEWSMRIAGARIKLGFMESLNGRALVHLQKPNKWNLKKMPDETLAKLKEYFKELPVKERNYY